MKYSHLYIGLMILALTGHSQSEDTGWQLLWLIIMIGVFAVMVLVAAVDWALDDERKGD